MTILQNPPPPIRPDFGNVHTIRIIYEHLSAHDSQLFGRKAMVKLMEFYEPAADVVACVNMAKLTIHSHEADGIISTLQPWCHGRKSQIDQGTVEDVMDEDEEPTEVAEDMEGVDEPEEVRDWYRPGADVGGTARVEADLDLGIVQKHEYKFYAQSHILMGKLLARVTDWTVVRDVLAFHLNSNSLKPYIFTRVSPGENKQDSA